MFRRFGSSVSIVYRGDQLLSREDGDIAAEVLKILQEDGIEGGEIMAMLQIAMMDGLLYTTLRDGIFAHPTLAESLNNLFTQVG